MSKLSPDVTRMLPDFRRRISIPNSGTRKPSKVEDDLDYASENDKSNPDQEKE